MYINDDCYCGYEPKEKLGSCKSEEIKEVRPIPNGPVISFTDFMDAARIRAKYCLDSFFSLCAKLTDFDKNNNQGWLYTEENVAVYDKNMAYFDVDEMGYYPVGDIEIFINTYGIIDDLADYLYNSFVTREPIKAEELDNAKASAYFSDKFDQLSGILYDISGKFMAIINAFQPDNELVKNIANMDASINPGYMSYMDHLLCVMSTINDLLLALTEDIFGYKPVKEDVKND